MGSGDCESGFDNWVELHLIDCKITGTTFDKLRICLARLTIANATKRQGDPLGAVWHQMQLQMSEADELEARSL